MFIPKRFVSQWDRKLEDHPLKISGLEIKVTVEDKNLSKLLDGFDAASILEQIEKAVTIFLKEGLENESES